MTVRELKAAFQQLHTPKETAEIIGCSLPTLWRERKRRAITFVKLGGRVFFSNEAILDYRQRHEIKAASHQ